MTDRFDVIVVGGGIIGCAMGWQLARTGRRVAIVERGRLGGEATSAAGGILIPANAPGLSPALLEFWKVSHAAYPTFVAETREVTGAAFEYRVLGRLVVGFGDDDVERLREVFALQAAVGVRAEWLSAAEVRDAEPNLAPDAQAAIFYPDHALVDNPRFTVALGQAARWAGVRIAEGALVIGLSIDGDRVVGVQTATEPLEAPVVVNCAGSWAGRLDPRVSRPVRPAKGQMLAVDRGDLVLHHLVEGGGGSAVPRADGRTLIGATVHDVGYNKDVIAGDIFGLFARTARLVPGLSRARFLEGWAGLRPVCPDYLPLIGPDPRLRGFYWATGHYTMGILGAPATAHAIADLIDRGTTTIPIADFRVDRFADPERT